jgi:hypothetical protein
VTAITTAGLLAGLFGSAFVPVARAAAISGVLPATDDGDAVAKAGFLTSSAGYDGTLTDGAGVIQYYAVKSKVITFKYLYGTSAEAAAEIPTNSTTVTWTLTAGTITSISGTGTAITNVIVAPDGKSATMLTDASSSAAELGAVGVNVTAPSSGTMKMTISGFTNSGAAGASAAFSSSVTLTIVAAAKTATPVSVGSNSTLVASNIDESAALAWSDDHNTTDGYAVLTAKNEYNVAITTPTTKLVEVSSSDATKVNVHVATGAAGTVAYASSSGTSVALLDASAQVKVGIYPEQDASGTVTLTFKVAGTVVATRSYTVRGPVATITPTRTIQYVAAGGALSSGTALNNAFTLVAKDAAGTTVAHGAYAYTLDGADTNKVSATTATTTVPAYGQFTSGLCATADAGTTKSIVATSSYTSKAAATVTVSSVAWTITCTGAAGIVTKIAFDKAAYLPSSTVYVEATATDSGGRPLGYGGGIIESGLDKSGTNGAVAETDDEFSIVKQGTLTLADVNTTTATVSEGIIFTDWVNGVASWSATSHSAVGDFGLVLTIVDNDPVTAGDQEKVFSPVATVSNILSSVVDGTLVAGSKKLKATATFGAAAANKKIAFTLENTRTGVVKTYYRKANASGVATFTLSFRGTFDVTAAYGDYMTDTVTLKK